MSKRELNSLLSRLLPYIYGKKQATALFTIVLLLGLSHGAFDDPHLHVESVVAEPRTATLLVTNASSGTLTSSWSPYNPYGSSRRRADGWQVMGYSMGYSESASR